MEDKNYITILGWMVNKLNLTGNELLCYALIYGFSQDKQSSFTGSRKYIAEILGFKSLNSVDTLLKKLVDSKLIIKESQNINNVVFNSYKTNLQHPYFQKSDTPSKFEYPTSKFEYDINKDINKEEIKENTKRKKESTEPTDDDHAMFEEFRKKYKGKKRGHDTEFNFFISQNSDWKKVLPQLCYAVEKENQLREQARMTRTFFPEPKNMQTYLNGKNRGWELYLDGIEKFNSNDYNPICDGVSLMWNDVAKCHLTPFDITTLNDGYNAENRPETAIVMWRGYRYKWNRLTKQWEIQ